MTISVAKDYMDKGFPVITFVDAEDEEFKKVSEDIKYEFSAVTKNITVIGPDSA